jgi:hypothetical protein
VGVISENQAAKAQSRALNAQNEQRQREIDRATTAEINDRLREKRREQGRIAVAAGEAGLSLQSGSVEALLMDSAQQAELSNDRSLANRESRKLAAAADAQAQVPSRTTTLGAGLRIASAAASAGISAKKRT